MPTTSGEKESTTPSLSSTTPTSASTPAIDKKIESSSSSTWLLPVSFVVLAIFLYYYLNDVPITTSDAEEKVEELEDTVYSVSSDTRESILLTSKELKLYNGKDGNPLYLVCLGRIFDVSAGKTYYGGDSGYASFVGQDNSAAFATGEFSMDVANDDVSALNLGQINGVVHWCEFYEDSEKYHYIGKHIGRFYNDQGEGSTELIDILEKSKESTKLDILVKEDRNKYPTCNSRWTSDKGGKLWCSNKGVEIRFPRLKLNLRKNDDGEYDTRCACLTAQEIATLPDIKEYDNCQSKALTCHVPKNEKLKKKTDDKAKQESDETNKKDSE